MTKQVNFLLVFLILSILSSAQQLSSDQLEFIQKNAVSINNENRYTQADWSAIVNEVKDSRLVLLGEFNHGSKEVFLSRNELIKALHHQLDFDLILFESGLGEVGVVNLQMRDDEGEGLTRGFFGGWRTKEFEDLLSFAAQNQMEIAGFDVQRTGSVFTDFFQRELGLQFVEAEKQFLALKPELANYRSDYSSIEQEASELIQTYDLLKTKYDGGKDLVYKTLENRITFLSYMLDFVRTKDWNERWKARDQAMAENIRWLLSEVFEPNRKAIIIAHNFHISRYNEKEEVMGEFLAEEFGDQMYVLGVFAGKGSYSDNSGEEQALMAPDSTKLDIKHIVAADRSRLSFLDIPKNRTKGSGWLWETIIVNDTFVDLSGSNSLTLSKCFDGLLLLDEVSPSK
ncbi:MAG: erythromycin esterase family protein [Cyclobacteriaceae bacterium]